jgi:hypothetical protein
MKRCSSVPPIAAQKLRELWQEAKKAGIIVDKKPIEDSRIASKMMQPI